MISVILQYEKVLVCRFNFFCINNFSYSKLYLQNGTRHCIIYIGWIQCW